MTEELDKIYKRTFTWNRNGVRENDLNHIWEKCIVPNLKKDKTKKVKKYLKKLLLTLWEEGECFNSKRPFGDSGWEYEIYEMLVKDGLVEGTIDQEIGGLYECDYDVANKLVKELIKESF